MQSGIAHMFISTEDLEWQSELDHANRAFAAMVGGQRYENITREEAKRLRQPQPAHEAVPVEKNVGLPGNSYYGQRKAPPERGAGANLKPRRMLPLPSLPTAGKASDAPQYGK